MYMQFVRAEGSVYTSIEVENSAHQTRLKTVEYVIIIYIYIYIKGFDLKPVKAACNVRWPLSAT